MQPSYDTAVAHRAVVALLAAATGGELTAFITAIADGSDVSDLKPPETGLVMLRGRTGGDGAAFNVGEATVTRAVVRIGDAIGYSYRLGRDKSAARNAAILDALWQMPERRERIETLVLAPIRERIAAARAQASCEAASSRVEFFTLARESA